MNPFSPEGGYPSPGAPVKIPERPAPIPLPANVDSAGGNPAPLAPERTDQAPTDTGASVAPEQPKPTATLGSQSAPVEGAPSAQTEEKKEDDVDDQVKKEDPPIAPDAAQSTANSNPAPAPSGPANPSQVPAQTETVHIETEIGQIKEEFNQIVDILLKKYGMEDIPIDQWGGILDDLNKKKSISPSTYNALKTYTRILKTERVIKTKKEKTHKDKAASDAKKPAQPNASTTPETFPTDGEIEGEFGKAKNGQYYAVNEQNEIADPNNPEVMYLGQTYGAFIKELEGMPDDQAKRIVAKLKPMLTRSIKRPDVYLFDTSPNKELKTQNDVLHAAVGYVAADTENRGGILEKIREKIRTGEIKHNLRKGRLSQLILLYHDTPQDSPDRLKLSSQIYANLKGVSAKELKELEGKHSALAEQIRGYQKEYPNGEKNPNKLFTDQLKKAKDHCKANFTSLGINPDLIDQIPDEDIPGILSTANYIHVNMKEIVDPQGKIKPEYAEQYQAVLKGVGIEGSSQKILTEQLSRTSGLTTLSKELYGIDLDLFGDEEMLSRRIESAANVIYERLQTDNDPALRDGLGNEGLQVLMELLRLDSGKPEEFEYSSKWPGYLGKLGMGGLLLWSKVFDVLSTDYQTLAPGGGQHTPQ